MGGSSGSIYAPSNSNLSSANSNLNSLQGQNYGALQGYTPSVTSSAQGITSQLLNNPYAPLAQQGANTAANLGITGLAPAQSTMAGYQQGTGAQLSGAIPGALAAGANANTGLYNQDYSRTLDQSNAINAMQGLGGSPYAAGLTDNAIQNFNNQWDTQQVGLQNTAAQTANLLGNAAGNAFTNASNLGGSALNTFNTAAQLPSTAYTSNLTGQLGALSGQNTAVGGAADIINNLASQYQNYLQYGTNAGAQQAQAQQSAFSGLGSLFGNLLGMGGGGAGSSGVSSLFGTGLSSTAGSGGLLSLLGLI